jgi:hypothetical protein
MIALKFALKVFVVLMAALCAVPFGLFVIFQLDEAFFGPSFQDDDPQYAFINDTFVSLVQAQSQSGSYPTGVTLDFAQINDGDWAIMCLLGGYSSPSRMANSLGGTFSAQDTERLKRTKAGLRLFEIEEWETGLLYVDSAKRAHFVHFGGGFGPGGQHYEKCIYRPDTVMELW